MKKIKQREVASTLDISDGHLSDMIRGRRFISRRLALKINTMYDGITLNVILRSKAKHVFCIVSECIRAEKELRNAKKSE